jgi:hypothetical protein
MMRLLLILILTFSFQTLSKADDIKDFEIEGMSVGDSLLEFMEKSAMEFKFLYKNKLYKTTFFNNPKTYEDIQLTVKSNDDSYIIHNITGKIYYKKDYYKCLQNKIEITKDFQSLISSDTKKQSEDNIKRSADPTGNSYWSYDAFYFSDGSVAQVFCTDWSEELFRSKNYWDELKVGLYSAEFSNYLYND